MNSSIQNKMTLPAVPAAMKRAPQHIPTLMLKTNIELLEEEEREREREPGRYSIINFPRVRP